MSSSKANYFNKQVFGDGILPGNKPESQVNNEVTNTIDLSLFEKVEVLSNTISIGKGGDLQLSYGIGMKLPEGTVTMEMYINSNGSIVFLKQNPNGELKFRAKDKFGKRCWCSEVARRLKSKGVELPGKYAAEYSEKLGGWVGRLVKP